MTKQTKIKQYRNKNSIYIEYPKKEMVIVCNGKYPEENNIKYKEHFDSFSYELSDFQKYAIHALVDGHHILISAPTGSGKTLPAEFAIQYFTSKGKKLIYTSPIKALSNQKYYEFTKKFPNISVGLMTGDIKLNPNADVIIMTTEILMNYLFNTLGNDTAETNPVLQFQMDITNELGCVVFDEVHYILDENRGQNWEQTILMLPKHIQMLMLSATIDSPERFAKWCERGDDKEKKVFLAYTNHRIVPLTHYGFLTTNESVYKGLKDKVLEKEMRDSTNNLVLLQSAKGEFHEAGYKQLLKTNEFFVKRNVFLKRKMVLNNLTQFLKEKDMLPAIAFVFSRKNVESCAKELNTNLLEDDSKVPYTIRKEAEQIVRKLPNFKEYLELPEYISLIQLLEKGIGIHHSGMIPILREIVELFISKKYIKILFATESFSIGLDCPIKTAVFTGIRKFDGNSDRYLLSHEYTQMAGRAGRRGIDTIGHVVHCNNLFKLPSKTEYKNMMSGKPQELVSKFNISYPVIMNLLKQKATTEDIYRFIEKSMIKKELLDEAQKRKRELELIQKKLTESSSSCKGLKIEIPESVYIHYQFLKSELKHGNKNKRKIFEKELSELTEVYPLSALESNEYKEFLQLTESQRKSKEHLDYIENFIKNQVNKITKVLLDRKYIKKEIKEIEENKSDLVESSEMVGGSLSSKKFLPTLPSGKTIYDGSSKSVLSIKEDNYVLDNLGIIASNINEINGLILSYFMNEWKFFDEFSVLQIVGLFSCFTDIRVPEDMRKSAPFTKDVFLKLKIQDMVHLYGEFDKIETEMDLRTGIDYATPLNFDVTDEIIEWCSFDNETDCKHFIQTKLAVKEISIGEFTKAILKVSIVTKEVMNICELIGQIGLMNKLSQIDGMILKYITICQSLYV